MTEEEDYAWKCTHPLFCVCVCVFGRGWISLLITTSIWFELTLWSSSEGQQAPVYMRNFRYPCKTSKTKGMLWIVQSWPMNLLNTALRYSRVRTVPYHSYSCQTISIHNLVFQRYNFSSVKLLSRVRPFVTPMDCTTPRVRLIPCDPNGLQHTRPPIHHQLLEPIQTLVHWVGDAIQPSHPLPSPSPPTFNLTQHQNLFKWVSSSHQVVRVLEFQL